MTGRDLTSVLPPELIVRFFRGWTFEELHPMLGVCARWREIGLNHPIYWRSIALKGPMYNSVLLSLLRVERTYDRPFSWTIDVLTPPGTLSRILSVVSAHLEQLVALEICVPNIYAHAVFAALRLPASQLTAFRLEFLPLDPDATAPHLCSDLFAQSAPKLRKVGLCGVDLAERLPIFEPVTDVTLGAGSQNGAAVPCVFTHFPSAEHVHFSDCTTLRPSQRAPNSFWLALQSLTVTGNAECQSCALRNLPLRGMRNVELFSPSSAEMDSVCSHLHGELDLSIMSSHQYDRVETFVLDFSEHITGRRRRFAHPWRSWETDPSSDVVAPSLPVPFDIAERLVALDISADILARTCALLPPLPNLDSVCSHLHGELDLSIMSSHQYDRVETFVLDFSEHITGRRRRFAHPWRSWETDPSSDVVAPSLPVPFDIAERLVALDISADILARTCALLPPLPNVAEITVLFHYWAFGTLAPARPLSVPKLRILELQGHEDVPVVPRSFVTDVCINALTGYPTPLTVVVKQVVIPKEDPSPQTPFSVLYSTSSGN